MITSVVPWSGAPDVQTFALNTARVLVVSAWVPARRQVAGRLREDGYHVIESRNGLEVLASASPSVDRSIAAAFVDREGRGHRLRPAHDPVDLLILDLSQDCWDGLALLESVRILDVTLPVIVIADDGCDEVIVEARRLGVQALFVRPFDLDRLAETVWALEPPLAAAVGY